MSGKIVVLTEAGFEKGFGHFYRMSSLVIAAIKKNISAIMVIDGDEAAINSLQREYVCFKKWQNAQFDITTVISKNDVVVVDSYNVTLERLNQIAVLCKSMFVIDDNMRLDYYNMKIVNPNYYAEHMQYPDNKGNSYYLGRDYTLLRETFKLNKTRLVREKVEEVLITMGGTDLKHNTAKSIKTIREVEEDPILNVVITSAYNDKDQITELLNDKDRLYIDASQEIMTTLMNNCDFAISSGGGTTNELIKMQCPAAIVVVADNQRLNADYMSERGCFCLLDGDNDKRIIKQMFSKKQREYMVSNMKQFESDRTAIDLVFDLFEGK